MNLGKARAKASEDARLKRHEKPRWVACLMQPANRGWTLSFSGTSATLPLHDLVGDVHLVSAGKGVSLTYAPAWLHEGFALSEDLPLVDIEHHVPRQGGRSRRR